jgi:hypothetical protein
MLGIIAAFVETPYYVVAAALVIFVAVFSFALKHDKNRLLPFIASTLLVIAVSTAFRLFPLFFISIPTLMIGLTIHLSIAAWKSALCPAAWVETMPCPFALSMGTCTVLGA